MSRKEELWVQFFFFFFFSLSCCYQSENGDGRKNELIEQYKVCMGGGGCWETWFYFPIEEFTQIRWKHSKIVKLCLTAVDECLLPAAGNKYRVFIPQTYIRARTALVGKNRDREKKQDKHWSVIWVSSLGNLKFHMGMIPDQNLTSMNSRLFCWFMLQIAQKRQWTRQNPIFGWSGGLRDKVKKKNSALCRENRRWVNCMRVRRWISGELWLWPENWWTGL